MHDSITLDDLRIDRDRYCVWVRERNVDLTYLEFELLFRLASQPERVISRQEICAALWGEASTAGATKLTVHVSRLRKKIKGGCWAIQTVKKRGYVLTDAGERLGARS